MTPRRTGGPAGHSTGHPAGCWEVAGRRRAIKRVVERDADLPPSGDWELERELQVAVGSERRRTCHPSRWIRPERVVHREPQQVARRETCQCVRARFALQHRRGRPCDRSSERAVRRGHDQAARLVDIHEEVPCPRSIGTTEHANVVPAPGSPRHRIRTSSSPSALPRNSGSRAHTFAGSPTGNLLGVPLGLAAGHRATDRGDQVPLRSGPPADGGRDRSPARSRRSRTLWWDRRWWPPTQRVREGGA